MPLRSNMNISKIKELSDKAQAYAVEQYGQQRKGEQVWQPSVYDLKFAELIVEECIQVAGPEDAYQDEWFKAKTDSVLKIKEYFGVKNVLE